MVYSTAPAGQSGIPYGASALPYGAGYLSQSSAAALPYGAPGDLNPRGQTLYGGASLSVIRVDTTSLSASLSSAGNRFMDAADLSYSAAEIQNQAAARNAATAERLERTLRSGGDGSALFTPGRDLAGDYR